MTREIIENQQENKEEITVQPPFIESFLGLEIASKVWPEKVFQNPDFIKEVEQREELRKIVGTVFEQLPRPDINWQTAVEAGLILEKQVSQVYEGLADLFENNSDYQRLALYLPFELLPSADWNPQSEILSQAKKRFQGAYLKAWKNLHTIYDVRANFVDGDVLEVEHRTGDLPRVVKAAHLIPILVEKKWITISDVIELMEKSNDNYLRNSIADSLSVLADLSYLTEEDLGRMENSSDQLTKSMAKIILSENKASGLEKNSESNITFSLVKETLYAKLAFLEEEGFGAVAAKRKTWLKKMKRQKIIEELANQTSHTIRNGGLDFNEIKNFLESEATPESQIVLIEGIRKAIESNIDNLEEGKAFFWKFKEFLLELWAKEDPQLKDFLAKAYRRFNRIGVVSEEQLKELKIEKPKLAGPFSENLSLMKPDLDETRKMIEMIQKNPEIAKYIFPVVLIFGSKLKGYGAEGADIDLGIFVRPQVPYEERAEIQKLLKITFNSGKIPDKPVEFWLEESDGLMQIKDFENRIDPTLGTSTWTHVLFGAAWEGDKEKIKELKEKLLANYLSETDKKIQGRPVRQLYLEELERDTLQYRLMHNGYERFFPPYGGIHTLHSDDIDGESMFYDSGYRQLATQLFLSRVFLPEVSALKNKEGQGL